MSEHGDRGDARATTRGAVDREVRAARALNATDAIGTLTPGCEIFILTYGQFSLIDAIAALVRQTGPADVILSTWTAGHTDLTTCANLLDGLQIRSFRMAVDRSFATRQPGYCRRMIELFGIDCIRTWRAHAKFAVIQNGEWSLAIRTSMNLNNNMRLENIEISDDPNLCGFLVGITDDLFEEQEVGIANGEMPALENVEFSDPKKIEMGRATASTVTFGRRAE